MSSKKINESNIVTTVGLVAKVGSSLNGVFFLYEVSGS